MPARAHRLDRKIAVFVGSAALATGVGVGVVSQGGDTATSQAAGMTQQPGGRPAGGGMDLDALAEQLGVSEDKVAAALESIRPDGGQGAPPAGAGGTPPASG